MSKLAKKPIIIPEGVEVKNADGLIQIKGKQGTINLNTLSFLSVEIKDKEMMVKSTGSHKQARANWGTMASLLKNAIQGVTEGYSKILEVAGVGFRANMEGNSLILTVGFTHPVKYNPPEGVKITVDKIGITVSGINKELVGLAASQIRKVRPPEPYQGKGIHYKGEQVRRKEGKKVAGTGTAS
ncbi:MAG: 50S ribosomal protein L6 [Patescibacteria group bacterium]